MRWIGGTVALAAVLVAAPGARAQAPSYTYVPIGTLGTNYSTASAGYGINETGEVTGWAVTNRPGHTRAIRWDDGRITSLGTALSEGTSSASDINDAGVIVGAVAFDRYQPSHPFVLRDGKRTILGTGYGSDSWGSANAINSAGEIVGNRSTGGRAPSRGFLWRDGKFIDLGSLGGTGGPYNTETSAEDINDHGQVVGATVPAKGYPLHAYLWEDGKMRDLGVLGPDNEATQAFAINNRGQVVGSSYAHSLQTEGFLWENGTMTQLEPLGDDGAWPNDINDAGVIVGSSKPADSYALHAALWSDGQVRDLNDLVTNLPANVSLGTAEAINESGVIVGRSCLYSCDAGKTALEHGYILIPDGLPVPTSKPTLVDTSSNARPVTMAGPSPTAAPGRWGDGLRFGAGGRLETPAFEIPYKHSLAAWVAPDGGGPSVQTIVGQWRADAGVTRLFYDGAQHRYGYSVVDADGQTVTFTTPPGSAGAPGFRYLGAGITKTGQLTVAIDGRRYCGAPHVTSIAQGGDTPITVGAAADGGQPFRGVIEGALVQPSESGTEHYRLPWWEHLGSYLSVYFFFDADQRIPHYGEVPIVPPPPAPTDPPCPATTTPPAPSPTPTTSPTPSPTPTATATAASTPTATPSPSPVATASPSPVPSPTATPTPSPIPTPLPSATPTPSPTATPTPSSPTPTPTPSPTPGPVWAPPAPAIIAPASYSWSRSTSLTLSGTAQPGATVEVFDGSRSFGTTTATAVGTWSRAVSGLADGAYLFTARAQNLGGTSPHSAIRVIQVDATAPAAPAITAPAGSAATSFTLTGRADPGTTVEVFENGVSRGTVAAGNGTWSKAFTGMAAGTRAYTARATDFAGNTSAVSPSHTLRVG